MILPAWFAAANEVVGFRRATAENLVQNEADDDAYQRADDRAQRNSRNDSPHPAPLYLLRRVITARRRTLQATDGGIGYVTAYQLRQMAAAQDAHWPVS
jgi:hypothetical protein